MGLFEHCFKRWFDYGWHFMVFLGLSVLNWVLWFAGMTEGAGAFPSYVLPVDLWNICFFDLCQVTEVIVLTP